MSRIVKIQGLRPCFPSTCVVCQKPSVGAYPIERTFFFGRGSTLLQFQAPMCAEHLAQASRKGKAEQTVEWTGLVIGALAGLVLGAWLFSWWSDTAQGSFILNLILAVFLAASVCLVVWAVFKFWLSGRFISLEQNRVRTAVWISKYWPGENVLELGFENEAYAACFMKENAQHLAEASES